MQGITVGVGATSPTIRFFAVFLMVSLKNSSLQWVAPLQWLSWLAVYPIALPPATLGTSRQLGLQEWRLGSGLAILKNSIVVYGIQVLKSLTDVLFPGTHVHLSPPSGRLPVEKTSPLSFTQKINLY